MANSNILKLAKQDATYQEALELVLSAARGQQPDWADDDAVEEACQIVQARLDIDFPEGE